MAMTLSQLEKYIAAEVENLHIKIDLLTERMDKRFDALIGRFDRSIERLDRAIERIDITNERLARMLENHETRIIRIERKA